MQTISLLQIAPTLAAYFVVALHASARPVRQILDMMTVHKPQVVVLAVIDSLDLKIYTDFAPELIELHRLVEQGGLIFACPPVSTHTTPAIAAILTGLSPESHGIVVSEDVATSEIKSILEILHEHNIPTAAVLDTNGAQPLEGRMSYVIGIENREDIVAYDAEITAHTISILANQHEVQLTLTHLRSIDRFAHRGWDLRAAAGVVNERMREIIRTVAERNGMLFICGDHEAHLPERKAASGQQPIPLIVAAPV
ncbi:MAG: alkaline phosphatase family protein [Methanomicrobia archaeon]|nr:alkaline phosphatase family protein [Methanomicrobia archaeon]